MRVKAAKAIIQGRVYRLIKINAGDPCKQCAATRDMDLCGRLPSCGNDGAWECLGGGAFAVHGDMLKRVPDGSERDNDHKEHNLTHGQARE